MIRCNHTKNFTKEKNTLKQDLIKLRCSAAAQFMKERVRKIARALTPCLIFIAFSTVAHAQGSMDFSGATTLMTTFKTFCMYAGAVICLVCLVWAGIKMMGGRFTEAIPQLFGALFGAGVLGWGAGWISSLTGQSVS
jgi:hypothetical protein